MHIFQLRMDFGRARSPTEVHDFVQEEKWSMPYYLWTRLITLSLLETRKQPKVTKVTRCVPTLNKPERATNFNCETETSRTDVRRLDDNVYGFRLRDKRIQRSVISQGFQTFSMKTAVLWSFWGTSDSLKKPASKFISLVPKNNANNNDF